MSPFGSPGSLGSVGTTYSVGSISLGGSVLTALEAHPINNNKIDTINTLFISFSLLVNNIF